MIRPAPLALGAGPIASTVGGAAVLRPVPFQVEGGFWALRQRVNSERSIPHGIRQLRAHGQWDDLRRAAGRQTGTHTGRPYNDSDVYKMAEAVAWDGASTTDQILREIAALVVDAQEETGYVNSWFQCTGTPHFSDLHLGHEMYCAGHLIQAAIAAVRSCGSTELLAPAVAFADHLVDTFGAAGRAGICGHPQIETALVELYRLTGGRPYLALAQRMIDLRGHGLLGPGRRGAAYYQDDTPLREAEELDGHCVRAIYLATGATDVYLETGDTTLLSALTRLWDHTVATKTYVTGGVGCRRKTEAFGAPYELPPDQAFNETCAGAANIMWSWRLLLATGDGRYADHIERVLFNVLAAGVSLTGDHFSYINTLHRRGSAMEHGDKAPYRKPWFGCPCCPPNLMRVIASLGHYIATVDPDGVQIHQYATGALHTEAVDLAVRTGYPWSGEISLDITAARTSECTLRLRLPAWCLQWSISINGQPASVEAPARQYLSLRRQWRAGDRVTLVLAMPPRFTWPDRRIDAIRGCVAIERGPLVYCVEEADLPASVRLDDLALDTGTPLRAVPRPDLLGGIIAIQAAARCQPAGGRPSWPYDVRDTAPAEGSDLTVTAIPYHTWDNRDRTEMRTWIPTLPP